MPDTDQIDEIIKSIDQDDDGKFDFEEICRYLGPIIVAKKAFEVYDADDSGVLEYNEIRRLIFDLYMELGLPELTDHQLNGMIQTIDSDDDATISFDELIKVLYPILENTLNKTVIEHKT